MKRLLMQAAALAILSSRAFAEPHCIVDAAAGRVDASQDTVRAQVLAFGGKPLEVVWRVPAEVVAEGKPLALHIHRVTGARRIPLGVQEVALNGKDQQLAWKWEVPVTQGPATYEISWAGPKTVVLRVEAHDERLYREALKSLAGAKLSSEGLTPAEKAGLSGWGLKVEGAAGRSGGEASLALVREQDGKTFTRTIVLSDDRADAVVWCAGAGAGEWRMRVPRAWISAAALATDEGRIRLLSLLTETPNLP